MNISFPRTLLHGATQAFTRKTRSIISSLPKAILFVQFLSFFHSRMNVWSIQTVYRRYKMSKHELQITVAIRK
jgi:transaldolase